MDNYYKTQFQRTTQETITILKTNNRIKDVTKLTSYIDNIIKTDATKAELINTYNDICSITSRAPGDKGLTSEDFKIADNWSHALSNNSNQIVNYLRNIIPHDNWLIADEFWHNVIPIEILKPQNLKLSLFGYEETTYQFIKPEVRYIANSSAHEAYKYLSDTKLKKPLPGDQYKTRHVVLGGHSRMFKLLGSQERLANAETQIMMMLTTQQNMCETDISKYAFINHKKDHCNIKRGIDLVGMQAIRYLLKDRVVFPYTSSSGRMYVNDYKIDFSCTLPQIIITLLNICTHELLGTYTHEFAKLAVEYMFDKSRISICQEYLEKRKFLRDLEPLLYLEFSNLMTVERTKTATPVTVSYLVDFKDYDYDRKKKEIGALVARLTGIDFRVWKYIKNVITGKNQVLTNRLRWAKMLLGAITANSLYNKTSLTLEYEKSAAPIQNVVVKYPSIKTYFYDTSGMRQAIQWNWDKLEPKLIKGVHRVFKEKYHYRIVELLKTMDFEKEYAKAMTNRSEGIKVDDPNLPPRLQNVSNTRAISLALTPEDMFDYSRCVNKLREGGKCTIRFQISRRARVVVMVIKQKQAEQIVNLRGFEALKRLTDTIDVGQQKGDIRNSGLQLYGSSGKVGINNSSDLRGQDAHTMPVMSDFINSLYADTVIDNEADRYYCKRSENVNVTHGTMGPIPTRLSAVFQYTKMVTREGRPTKYILRDECFRLPSELVISDFTYESGLYGTTAQHTTLISLEHEARVEDFNAMSADKIISIGRSVGDDFYELISATDDEITRRYLEYSELRLSEVNFELEANVSKVFSTFLQNDCLCGLTVPKPDRMSLFCEEKNEVRVREKLDIIKNLVSLGKIVSQRAYSNNNVRALVMSGWNNLRSISYQIFREDTSAVIRLAKRKFLSDWLIFDKATMRMIILLPYLTVCVPPLSFSLPPLDFGIHQIPGTAMTSPNGDINWLHFRQLLDTNPSYDLKDSLINPGFPLDKNKSPTRLSDILKRPSEEINHNLLHKLGINFASWYVRFRRNELLNEQRDEEVTLLYKDKLVNFYRQYQDQHTAYLSIMAYNEFTKRGIRVSKRLAYFSRPEKKIDDALMAREQNLTERKFLDSQLFKHLGKYKGKVPYDVLQIWDSFAMDVVDTPDVLPYSDDFLILRSLPTVPSYHENDDFGKLFARVGGVARFSNYTYSEYQTISAALDGIGGSELVIRESKNILSKFAEKSFGISLLMQYFAIPKHLFTSFQKVLSEDSRMFYYTPYQSYVENQAFMDIDSTTYQTRNQVSQRTYLDNLEFPKLNRFIDITQTHVRDLINSKVNTLSNPITDGPKKVKVLVKPYSYAKWTQFTRIDVRFVKYLMSKI